MTTISMSTHAYVQSATILVVLALAPVAAASQQAAADRPQPVGFAQLTGRVIASDDGGPVRRADIRLSGLAASEANSGPPRSVERSSETDANGDFDFPDLPAGSYSITVHAVSGFVQPSQARRAVVSERQTVRITIRLDPTGAIEGRVLDENGDGVLGMEVHAVRRINIAGYRTIAPSGRSARTDDRGRFRIFDVPGGEYYVAATYVPRRRNIDPIPRLGYSNTYHPESLTLDRARVVVVRRRRNTERVDIKVTARRSVKVFVRAVNSHAAPLDKDARLSLHRRDPFFSEASLRFPNLPKNGMFVFDDIVPGTYSLIVAASSRLEEAAYVDVTVAEEDLSLNVQTNTGARVSGRVLVDGAPLSAAAGVGGVSVFAHRPWGDTGLSYAEVPRAETHETDRFELIGLRGPMVIDASIGVGTLVAIKRAGQPIAGRAVDYVGTETIDDIVIEFTKETARLEVEVAATGSDPEPVLILLFSDDPSSWSHGGVQYTKTIAWSPSAAKSGESTVDSPITLPPVPPGRYRVVAIHDPEISYPDDTAIFEKLRPFATLVTLMAGTPTKISLQIANVVR